MNVDKIQRLSKQYAELKNFHATCCEDVMTLVVESCPRGKAEINYDNFKLIVVELRGILLDKMKDLEEKIKEEIING
ncbi:MAG: hypothetical protein A7316_10220 [Candidatus Altiarchaeales archaeon WOR_SM1_86-2]|nr:MAG: hypothetical protein A7316_10220 [Candidatus Altiarchaeales archaeon WOR_SM1_86-2]